MELGERLSTINIEKLLRKKKEKSAKLKMGENNFPREERKKIREREQCAQLINALIYVC
jgi:hypothetical protein